MQSNSEMSWAELKNKYDHYLKTYEISINNAHKSSIELDRIFNQIMNKAKDSSHETMKDFARSWLKRVNTQNHKHISSLIDSYDIFMNKYNQSENDFQDFHLALLHNLHLKPIRLLDSYKDYMSAFYYTWKEKWSE